MEGLPQVIEEVERLKKELAEVKALGADKVLIATVEELDRRVTEIERFIGNKGEAGN